MTLPKGYVLPEKKTDDKAKQLADDKAKQLADDKAKQLADDKAKQLADDKAKQLADDKAITKGNNANLSPTENSYKKQEPQNNTVNVKNGYQNNNIDYDLLWNEMKQSYMQTVNETTNSYFRLLEFWMKNFKK
jgi:membrane protein involved in colicin uptake